MAVCGVRKTGDIANSYNFCGIQRNAFVKCTIIPNSYRELIIFKKIIFSDTQKMLVFTVHQ